MKNSLIQWNRQLYSALRHALHATIPRHPSNPGVLCGVSVDGQEKLNDAGINFGDALFPCWLQCANPKARAIKCIGELGLLLRAIQPQKEAYSMP